MNGLIRVVNSDKEYQKPRHPTFDLIHCHDVNSKPEVPKAFGNFINRIALSHSISVKNLSRLLSVIPTIDKLPFLPMHSFTPLFKSSTYLVSV